MASQFSVGSCQATTNAHLTTALAGVPRAPIIRQIAGRLRHPVNALVAHFSRLPKDAVLAPELFDWSDDLARRWKSIRNELEKAMPRTLPSIVDLAPDHAGINPDRRWKSVFLLGYGHRIDKACARFPCTWNAVRDIPGLFSAMISVHEPGARLVRHRGVTKGMITVHLPLRVPRQAEQCRIDVDGQIHVWREGQLFVFDDTYDHETWNETDEQRVILLLHVLRPLHAPGSWIQAAFFWAIQRSSFVVEAKGNVERWASGLTTQ